MALVSVIITHHLDENRQYLNQALEGLVDQDADFETIVIASSETPPLARQNVKVIHDKSLNTGCKKFNIAQSISSPLSKYFLFHSDDVVLSKGCLESMTRMAEWTGDFIQSPLSNSDIGTRYFIPGTLKPDMELTDRALREISILSGRYEGLLIRQDWITFFCPMIPRVVLNRVGPIDEKLESRYCDVDYCFRASKLGIPSVINAGAFAFHYGSKTLSKIAKPDDYKSCDKEWLAKRDSLR